MAWDTDIGCIAKIYPESLIWFSVLDAPLCLFMGVSGIDMRVVRWLVYQKPSRTFG